MSREIDTESKIIELERLLDIVGMTGYSPPNIWQDRVEHLLTALVRYIRSEHDDRLRTTEEYEEAEAEYAKGGDL